MLPPSTGSPWRSSQVSPEVTGDIYDKGCDSGREREHKDRVEVKAHAAPFGWWPFALIGDLQTSRQPAS